MKSIMDAYLHFTLADGRAVNQKAKVPNRKIPHSRTSEYFSVIFVRDPMACLYAELHLEVKKLTNGKCRERL